MKLKSVARERAEGKKDGDEMGGRGKSMASSPRRAGPDHPSFQAVRKMSVPHLPRLRLSLGLRNSF